MLASFLLVKKVDPNLPFPIETAPDAGNSWAKGKSGSRSKKSDKKKAKDKEKEKEENKGVEEKDKSNAPTASTAQKPPSAEPQQPAAEGEKPAGEQTEKKDEANATPGQAEADKKPPKEKAEDAKDANLKEYYQPVTFRIHSTNPKVLEPLNRVVKPADEVRKYMNEVMDRAERAPDGFLAYRLPREEIPEEPEPEEIKKPGTPVPVPSGRNRPSRGKNAVDESDAENSEFVEEPDEEEEEELKDFYGAPTGLLPMGPL